jgi:hypothetical protein
MIQALARSLSMFMLWLVLVACTNSSHITQEGTPIGTIPEATNTFAIATPSASASLTGRIAYTSGDNIWIMNADGSGKIQLTSAGPDETDYDPS